MLSNRNYNPLYYIDKLNIAKTAELIKDIELTQSNIVIADNGIEYGVYNKMYGITNFYTHRFSDMGRYFRDSYSRCSSHSICHGTNVQSVIDNIIRELKTNDFMPDNTDIDERVKFQPLMNIHFKYMDEKGYFPDDCDAISILINMIYTTIEEFVIRKGLNISVINISSAIAFTKGSTISYVNESLMNLQKAIDRAKEYGITIVTAAGNSGIDTNDDNILSRLNNLIIVGSIDINNEISEFSSYGEDIDFVAYGEGFEVYCGKDKGTSFAVPMVSATIALLKAINVALTPNEIYDILRKSATHLGEEGKNELYGYGLINPEKAVEVLINEYL